MRAAFVMALVGLVSLSACDSNGESDGVDGIWETTASYEADTILSETNYRVKGAYDITFTFDLQHDDGLVWGTVTAVFDGQLIAREAGRAADTLVFDNNPVLVDQVFGTLDGVNAEVDVPFSSTYEENLWTFTKVGGRLDLEGTIVNNWSFQQLNVATPQAFTFSIVNGERPLSVRRMDTTPTSTDVRPEQLPVVARDLFTVEGRTQQAVLKSIASHNNR